MTTLWRFDYRPSPSLPPLAWVAHVVGQLIEVECGTSVRCADNAFFEGTWVGLPDLAAVLDSTAPFGTGMVIRGGNAYALPPGHTMALLFSWRHGDELYIANTFVGLIAKTGLQLLPEADYTGLFARIAIGLSATPTDLPTSGGPIQYHLFENLRLLPGGNLEQVPKPRERPFTSYRDYVDRFDKALASALANAPGYEPVVAVSNGYDSTVAAIVGARHGLRQALTFREARPPAFASDASDSGEATALRLGMAVELFDRTQYMRRTDLPEAEFMASGYTGEEVPFVAFESRLRHRLMLTGQLGGWTWLRDKPPSPELGRKDFSACSVTEFRLRLDTVDLPITVFGMTEVTSINAISRSSEMQPWSVGGYYDKPIARRIIEEAGFARGSFATSKRAATALIHVQGEALMAPASVASVRAFAAAEGRAIDLSPRRRLTRLDRGLMKLSRRFRLGRLTAAVTERQRTIVQHRPQTGSILFRWGVATIRPRYDAIKARPARTTGLSARAPRRS